MLLVWHQKGWHFLEFELTFQREGYCDLAHSVSPKAECHGFELKNLTVAPTVSIISQVTGEKLILQR